MKNMYKGGFGTRGHVNRNNTATDSSTKKQANWSEMKTRVCRHRFWEIFEVRGEQEYAEKNIEKRLTPGEKRKNIGRKREIQNGGNILLWQVNEGNASGEY